MSTTPVATPPRSNNPWRILTIVCAVLVISIGGGLLVARYFAKNLRVGEPGQRVTISTPAGQIEVGKNETSAIGLPLYPGAAAVDSHAASLQVTSEEGERVGILAAHYRTSDPLDRVVDWYHQHLGSEFKREARGSSVHILGTDIGRADVAFISERGDLVRIVALRKTSAGLEIALVRMGKQEAQ